MKFDLIDLFIVLGLSQGFIFALAIFFNPLFKDQNNKYLASAILMVSIIGWNEWLSERGYDDIYYFIDFWGDDVPWILLFYVPLLIYFLSAAWHPLAKDRRRWYLLIPFLIFLVLNILIDLELDFSLPAWPWISPYALWIYDLEYLIAPLYDTILAVFAYRVIQTSQISNTERKWLMRLWQASTALILCWLVLDLIIENSGLIPFSLYHYLWIGISFFIYWLIYEGLFQFSLAKDQSALQKILETRRPAFSYEPKVTNLTKEKTHLQRFKKLMEEEQLYENPDLSLEDVAARLAISAGYLSQLINAQEGESFTSLLQAYRVEKVKEMLLDSTFNQYNLLAIGLEAGFKSKSAFYQTFKKKTGLTPNQFKKTHDKS